LIPGEVMVKRDKGFNAATNDWEFFELDVSKDGTKIRKTRDCRSGQSVWRELLWLSHGILCAKPITVAPTLPVTRAMIRALQRTDPRCDNLSTCPEDDELVKQLEQLLKAPK
jgi:hypothetical protein